MATEGFSGEVTCKPKVEVVNYGKVGHNNVLDGRVSKDK